MGIPHRACHRRRAVGVRLRQGVQGLLDIRGDARSERYLAAVDVHGGARSRYWHDTPSVSFTAGRSTFQVPLSGDCSVAFTPIWPAPALS